MQNAKPKKRPRKVCPECGSETTFLLTHTAMFITHCKDCEWMSKIPVSQVHVPKEFQRVDPRQVNRPQ